MKKKYFVVFITFLMLVMAISPMINSMEIKKDVKDVNNYFSDNIDLGITLNKCYLDTMYEESNDDIYVTYYFEIIIHNYGDYYKGNVLVEFETMVNVDGDQIPDEYHWDEFDVELSHNQDYTRPLERGPILSSVDYNEDKEKFIAGKIMKVSLNVTGDVNSENNVDWGAVKHWKDDGNVMADYSPTLAEIAASCLHSYRNIMLDNDLFYYETFYDYYDLDSLADILKNNRLGYIMDFSYYVFIITKDVRKIILECVEFAIACAGILIGIGTCLANLFVSGETLAFGAPAAELLAFLLVWFACVEPGLESLELAAKEWNASVRQRVQKFRDDLEAFRNWKDDEPWNNPITVTGSVSKVKTGEEVTISCRNYTYTYSDDDNDGVISFSFEVTSDPSYDINNYYCLPHDCFITIKGSKSKDFHSKRIFSWAFSDGTIRFNCKLEPKIKSINNCSQFIFKNNLYIFTFLQELIQGINTENLSN